MDNIKKLGEAKLHEKKSILLQAESDTHISDDDHEHAQKIWREFLNFLFIFENVETSVIIMVYI